MWQKKEFQTNLRIDSCILKKWYCCWIVWGWYQPLSQARNLQFRHLGRRQRHEHLDDEVKIQNNNEICVLCTLTKRLWHIFPDEAADGCPVWMNPSEELVRNPTPWNIEVAGNKNDKKVILGPMSSRFLPLSSTALTNFCYWIWIMWLSRM